VKLSVCEGASLLREITCYGITQPACHPAALTFPPLPQPKLVVDLATPEGCKAESIWVVVISRESLPANTATYLRNNRAVLWPGSEPATGSRKSNVLTTTPQSQVAPTDESEMCTPMSASAVHGNRYAQRTSCRFCLTEPTDGHYGHYRYRR